MNEEKDLRLERLSLLIGTMIGQISELLNCIQPQAADGMMPRDIYESLFDIHKMAALQIHELYYKGNKKEPIE